MKLIKLLNNPLFHQAEILAGKECLDKEFTSISTGSSIRNIPDFLMVYTGRNYEEPWSEYLERAKGKTAAAILLIGYRKSEFDLTGENIQWCCDHDLPLIWIPYGNIPLFIARLTPCLSENFSHAQRSENWMYDLCHKEHFIAEESTIESYGYNPEYRYYCLLLRLNQSTPIDRITLDQLLIQAYNILSRKLSSNNANVLNFTDEGSLVCFLPFARKISMHQIKSKIGAAMDKVTSDTQHSWNVYIGNCADTVQNFRNSFQNALKIQFLTEKCGVHTPISYYEDWQMLLLMSYAPDYEIQEYIEHWLGPILNHPELLDTLNMYIVNRDNLKKTASELFIHINTLKYRLEKIGELLDCDLHDTPTLNNLETALLYHVYLNGLKGSSLKYAEDYCNLKITE